MININIVCLFCYVKLDILKLAVSRVLYYLIVSWMFMWRPCGAMICVVVAKLVGQESRSDYWAMLCRIWVHITSSNLPYVYVNNGEWIIP